MKSVLTVFAALLIGGVAQASTASVCKSAAEAAAYNKWSSSSTGSFGDVQSGATDVIWVRDGVASYQVSILHRTPGSQTLNSANYSVRVRLSDCSIVKVRKF